MQYLLSKFRGMRRTNYVCLFKNQARRRKQLEQGTIVDNFESFMSKWQGKKARKAIVLYSNSQSYFEGEDCEIQRNRRQGISNGLKWNKSRFFISVLLNEIRVWVF